jgi:hypothetical protein
MAFSRKFLFSQSLDPFNLVRPFIFEVGLSEQLQRVLIIDIFLKGFALKPSTHIISANWSSIDSLLLTDDSIHQARYQRSISRYFDPFIEVVTDPSVSEEIRDWELCCSLVVGYPCLPHVLERKLVLCFAPILKESSRLDRSDYAFDLDFSLATEAAILLSPQTSLPPISRVSLKCNTRQIDVPLEAIHQMIIIPEWPCLLQILIGKADDYHFEFVGFATKLTESSERRLFVFHCIAFLLSLEIFINGQSD